MKLTLTQCFASALLLVAQLPAWAAGPRYPVSLDAVTLAVLAAHPEVAIGTVELPAPIVSRVAAPLLSAGALELSGTSVSGTAGRKTARVRLTCETDAVCLPFYATVLLARGASLPPQDTDRSPAHSPGLPVQVKQANDEQQLAARLLPLRSGARVQMQIDSGHLHLRFPVTCLQAGAPGAMIRVRGAAPGLVYQASVIDSETVRGTL